MSKTVVDELESPASLLPEVALAMRMVRTNPIPRPILLWLASPHRQPECPPHLYASDSAALIDEIISPTLETATRYEQGQYAQANQYLAAAFQWTLGRAGELGMSVGHRMLAASLLPIYRSLGAGEIHKSIEQARFRLIETVALVSLCHEIGSDLVEMLELSLPTDHSPHATLETSMALDLIAIGTTARRYMSKYDEERQEFAEKAMVEIRETARSPVDGDTPATPDWACPNLLWGLAGEIIADRSEIVLPRAWIETPMPWKSISEHWNRLSNLLEQLPENNDMTSVKAASNMGDDGATTTPHSTDGASRSEPQAEPRLLPKVLIAEVLSHNDPAFVQILRRQLATCREEARPISIASVVVVPESSKNQPAIFGSQAKGIRPWQQQLVNDLADHPEVVQPHAFITSDGELLLCIRDIERHEATSLIREGLTKVLSNSADGSALTSMVTAARYHAGIASTSAPTAGMSAEHLIEATCRCLGAASHQNKSAIKSIDVF